MDVLEAIAQLKEELDSLRPLPTSVVAQVEQKLRLESNYHSNAIEGNTLTLGETRSLILHGLTAHGKPIRDHLDIEGHDTAVKAIEAAIQNDHELNEVFIRNLHRVLLKEPYEMPAVTPDGRQTKRTITIGDYKTVPNNVVTSTGETYYYTPPEQVESAMGDLIDWYRAKEREGEHPIILAATFHYRFVRIHPFDDGNGRMGRLLMNMILIKHGYAVALIRSESRDEFINLLEQAGRTENLGDFISFIASCCEYALNLYIRAARGDPIDDVDDIDKEIVLFKRSLADATNQPFAAREYFASTLYPFHAYSLAKTSLFSDAFGRVQTLVSLFATSVDGEVVTVCEDSTSPPSSLDDTAMPDQLRSMSFSSSTYLTTFQGMPEHVLVTVENSTDAHRSLWTFSVGTSNVRLEYKGRDLEDLKKQFNKLLRKMMDDLEQRHR